MGSPFSQFVIASEAKQSIARLGGDGLLPPTLNSRPSLEARHEPEAN